MNDPHLDIVNSNHFINELQIYPIKYKIFMKIIQRNGDDVWSDKDARLVVKFFIDLVINVNGVQINLFFP